MRKRWEVVHCWQGVTSTLVPCPVRQFWTRRAAADHVVRLSLLAERHDVMGHRWYEVRRVGRPDIGDVMGGSDER